MSRAFLPHRVAAVSRLALALAVAVLLGACGQKGTLYLPSGEAAAQRATLPQVLNPARPASSSASASSSSGAATPTTQP